MNPISLAIREIRYRWMSSAMFALIVAVVTGAVTYFSVNNRGFQKEITRNARDIGSNVVILPAEVDQIQYHTNGGYSEVTMPEALVQQIIEYKASLNHLIPMLERKSSIVRDGKTATARVVGIRASIPMPGRPKAPMQKSIKPGQVQLGSQLAKQLGIQRDQKAEVTIAGQSFQVSRVNKSNGTWQDAAALMDLKSAQSAFQQRDQISRIEAIECTSEQCELTGLKSDVVLANELARITDQAMIFRREKMAKARMSLRGISRDNLSLLQSVLWSLLAVAIVALAGLNSLQRKSEVGVLQALGYGQMKVVSLFMTRALLLSAVGAALGATVAAWVALQQGQSIFGVTGKKLAIDWTVVSIIGGVAVVLAALASCVPALVAATRHPADVIGKDS